MSFTLPEPAGLPRPRVDAGGILSELMDMLFVPIAPGVEGLVREYPDAIEIGGIRAIEPGSGAVAAYLDALPTDKAILVPFVVNPQLAEMLERRGFEQPETVHHPLLGTVDGKDSWLRPAQ